MDHFGSNAAELMPQCVGPLVPCLTSLLFLLFTGLGEEPANLQVSASDQQAQAGVLPLIALAMEPMLQREMRPKILQTCLLQVKLDNALLGLAP